ncbi:UBX domain-containing protein 1 [Fopius arisanus]|uniref:UBX domain-containing protein 1 n=1 Tax=Fopius arisanus TaxID=64838 RepID=A0A0C9PXU5_9HYME|nr:PREDICTED: UBX domain-containing protein 1 [Fopius arisanus]
MPSADVAMLVDMGFTLSKAEKALQMTGNKGVEPAMEWLLAHSDDGEPSAESLEVQASGSAPPEEAKSSEATEESATEAKSLKCDVCGKLFKSSLEVEFHATKSGHDSFSESLEEKKPLTDEEKKEKLRLLEERMKQKRKEREENEKQEAYEREKFRIKSGKEIAEARRRLEELEMKKLLEQRKREKEEDRIARQKIREQIEADKAARRAKQAEESGQPAVSATSPTTPTSVAPAPKRDYNQTKIQIRLTNGETLTQSFGSKEQLSAVRLYVEMHRTDPPGPFNLMTSFPRKVFQTDDYDAPLDVLGLVPSAVVIVQKNVE